MSVLPVARVQNLTPELFWREFVDTHTPVVLCKTSVAEQFPARWDADSVAAALGEQQFHFKRSTTNAHPNFCAATSSEMFARESLTFRQFFERILRGPGAERSRYIFTGDEHFVARMRDDTWSVNPALEPLWNATVVPPFVPRQQLYSVWSWFSGRGVRTWLHYDNNGCHNLNVQLHGQKRCTLFPPGTVGALDFFRPGDAIPAYNCSRVDVDDPANARLLESVPRFEATLHSGDLLFIPAHWLHTFWHEGDYNANVNFWWKPLAHEHPEVDNNDVARRESQFNSHKQY
jgi:Cupin-like domain